MSESVESIRKLIDECSEEDRRDLKTYLRTLLPHSLERGWGIDGDTILSAISRSSDLTKRGVRGIIAEAVFVDEIIPTVAHLGWKEVEIGGDQPYDALLQKGEVSARIQVKLQRLETGTPKLYYPKHYASGTLFVVEVQKTRSGERTAKHITLKSIKAANSAQIKVQTRPYSFGDFDILAVNMHPSSGNWKDFRYTVASWLLPRTTNGELIEVFQPVAVVPNSAWTDELSTCLKWLQDGNHSRVLKELLHIRKATKKKRRHNE